VIGHAYRLYCLHSDADADPECAAPATANLASA